MSCSTHRFLGIATGILLALLLDSTVVSAESYVGAQLGVTVPQSLSGIDIFDEAGIFAQGTSLSLKNSAMWGGKAGHYFETTPPWLNLFPGKSWLGVETEFFRTTPDIKQQSFTIDQPGFPPLTTTFFERDLTVWTWAFNIVARYPGKRWQPYAGIGLGIFFANLSNDMLRYSQSSTRPGLNTQLGVRYLITDRLSAFGEWKFNHTRFSFDPGGDVALGFKGTYNVHMLSFGVAYHF